MKIVYARQPVDQSIFLAGPTPRTSAVPSWRPGAIKILQDQGFNGTVYVPEDGTSETIWEHEYDNQIDWEWEALGAATVIAFWIDRDLKTMPAFTTNIEVGLFAASGKCVIGYPDPGCKMSYIQRLAERYRIPVYPTLAATMTAAMVRCGA